MTGSSQCTRGSPDGIGVRWVLTLVIVLVCCNSVHTVQALSSPSFTTNPSSTLLASQLQNQMILAPLTRGGNLPFRRLCADFGMNVSMSEMVYAKFLLQGDRIEHARLRRLPNNNNRNNEDATNAPKQIYGVQIATNDVEEGVAAMRLAAAAGADFVDLNCGCPIHEATRRGLGSALLRSPDKLAQLVKGMVDAVSDNDSSSSIPLTVKVRLGQNANSVNVGEVVTKLREAGAAAVSIHGRTAIQGYSKAADWEFISDIVKENTQHYNQQQQRMSIVGNGDIFTHYEAQRRIDDTGVDAVMVGRGALIKPWIFREFQNQKSWEPTLEERVAIYRRLTGYCKDHFGDDKMGRKKTWNFLPWHFDFFARYIELPEDKYGDYEEGPLIQMRKPTVNSDDQDTTPPLELLLSHRSKQAHDRIASLLWESESDEDAVSKLTAFAESAEFEDIRKNDDAAEEEFKELSNIRNEGGKWHKRRGRNPKPPRTPEEIVAVRAERAAKRARLEMEDADATAKLYN